jgi:hypothetical protein
MIFEKLSHMSPREKVGLALAAIVILAVVLFYLVVRPVRNWFVDMARQIVTQEERVADYERILAPAYRTPVEQEYLRYEKYMQKRGSTAEESGQMQSTIEELASQSGITLGNTKQREARVVEGVEEYGVDLDVEGGLGNLVRFMHGLQESPQLLRVEKMTLSPKGRADSQDVKGTLTITKAVFL